MPFVSSVIKLFEVPWTLVVLLTESMLEVDMEVGRMRYRSSVVLNIFLRQLKSPSNRYGASDCISLHNALHPIYFRAKPMR